MSFRKSSGGIVYLLSTPVIRLRVPPPPPPPPPQKKRTFAPEMRLIRILFLCLFCIQDEEDKDITYPCHSRKLSNGGVAGGGENPMSPTGVLSSLKSLLWPSHRRNSAKSDADTTSDSEPSSVTHDNGSDDELNTSISELTVETVAASSSGRSGANREEGDLADSTDVASTDSGVHSRCCNKQA